MIHRPPFPCAFAQSSFGPAEAEWSGLCPEQILQASTLAEVLPVLAEVERRVESEGLSAIGFVAYEAAPALDAALVTQVPSPALPLVWFALARRVESVAPGPALEEWAGRRPDAPPPAFQPAWSRERHGHAIAEIKRRIAAGDTYQVNLTLPMVNREEGVATALPRLLRAQPTRHGAVVLTADWAVASASPELFFRLEGQRIVMRPMKGTRPRGRHTAEDEALRAELLSSAKDRAENLMIVDMVRNDLGRICRTGSVTVPRLFAAERYPTVWQMTSTVEGETGAGLVDLFRALFPCASVTGAPKVNTMRLIRDLESFPRGVYTGAIGLLRPGRRYAFNVAIRTLLADRKTRAGVYGVGSGVVWDSDPDGEYDECLQKAAVLRDTGLRPALLETLRWTPREGYWLRERHLARLADSATFLGYADPLPEAVPLLDAVRGEQALRVRLTVDPDGHAALTTLPLAECRPPPDRPFRVRLDPHPVDSRQRLLFHKTTDRSVYDAARARNPDVDDVLLQNERGELTESTLANLAVKLQGRWYTPPLSCGLLPGVLRAERLVSGEMEERILRARDLAAAEEWVLFNSVRGTIPTLLVPSSPGGGDER